MSTQLQKAVSAHAGPGNRKSGISTTRDKWDGLGITGSPTSKRKWMTRSACRSKLTGVACAGMRTSLLTRSNNARHARETLCVQNNRTHTHRERKPPLPRMSHSPRQILREYGDMLASRHNGNIGSDLNGAAAMLFSPVKCSSAHPAELSECRSEAG